MTPERQAELRDMRGPSLRYAELEWLLDRADRADALEAEVERLRRVEDAARNVVAAWDGLADDLAEELAQLKEVLGEQ